MVGFSFRAAGIDRALMVPFPKLTICRGVLYTKYLENVFDDAMDIDEDRDPFDTFKDDKNDKQALDWLPLDDFLNMNECPVLTSVTEGKRKTSYVLYKDGNDGDRVVDKQVRMIRT